MRVDHAVVVPPAGAAPAAVYLTVRNAGPRPDTLFGISVEGVGEAVLRMVNAHRVTGSGDGATDASLTRDVPNATVGPGAELRLTPGSLHAAIDRPARALVPGDSLRLVLRLGRGRTLAVPGQVVAFDALERTGGSTDGAARAPLDGKALYSSNGCPSCHGAEGHGDGRLASSLSPRPRDFRDASAFRNGADTAAITRTLATGIPGGGSMPLFPHLSNDERRAIAAWIITQRLPTSNSTKDQ